MGLYKFLVKCYEEDDSVHTYAGLVVGNTYAEAITNISQMYGEIYIEDVSLSCINGDAGGIIIVPPESIDAIIAKNNI